MTDPASSPPKRVLQRINHWAPLRGAGGIDWRIYVAADGAYYEAAQVRKWLEIYTDWDIALSLM
jgi:hypothetical protein